MKKKLLVGTIIVLGIVAVIVSASALMVPALPVWIYLVWMVWKKKVSISHDQIEPKFAERRLRWLKTFLLVAGISFAVFWVSVFPLRIVLAAIPNQPHQGERVVFLVGYSSVVLFTMATIGGLYMFLKGRRKTT